MTKVKSRNPRTDQGGLDILEKQDYEELLELKNKKKIKKNNVKK